MGKYVPSPMADPFEPSMEELALAIDAVCFLGNDEDDGLPRFMAHQANPWAIEAVEAETVRADGEGITVDGSPAAYAAPGDWLIRYADETLGVMTEAEMAAYEFAG
jgi:hypothetical protein